MSLKKIGIVLCIACLLSTMITAVAAATDIVPYASYIIDSTSIALNMSSGSNVKATAVVKATGTASKLGFKKITLYHKINGTWIVAASKSSSYGYQNNVYQDSVSCTRVTGREYKASCSSYVELNGSSDTGSASKGPYTAK